MNKILMIIMVIFSLFIIGCNDVSTSSTTTNDLENVETDVEITNDGATIAVETESGEANIQVDENSVTITVETEDGQIIEETVQREDLEDSAPQTFGAFSLVYLSMTFLFPLLILTFIVGLGVIIFLAFKPHLAKYFVFLYAIVEGVFLGLVSKLFEMMYPGIVLQAIVLTVLIALLMNILYQNRIIKVTEKFRSIMTVAILSVLGIYLISFTLMLFGITVPYIHSSGPIGILFSIVVVIIASLTFLLDFDMIESFSKQGLDKNYEWNGAFSLFITLIWLYIEILKLLSKIRRN